MVLPGSDVLPCDESQVTSAWSTYLGGRTILVRSLDLARELLLSIVAPHRGSQINIPVTATNDLVEAIRRAKLAPRFVNLTGSLELATESADLEHASLLWEQPPVGLARGGVDSPVPRIIDCGHTLPKSDSARGYLEDADAIIFGLHLSHESAGAGAAILFGNHAVGRQWEESVRKVMTTRHAIDARRAIAQLERVTQLSSRQNHNLAQIWDGLDQSAGLPLPPRERVLASPGLAMGVPIRIPDEVDSGTFYAYVAREQTPIEWLPLTHPIHHRVLSERGVSYARTAGEELSRWIVAPAGPDCTEEEITHTVLGVVKAAEYLGVRWVTNPDRTRWYSDLLTEWYGPDHDAFRPIFPTTTGKGETT